VTEPKLITYRRSRFPVGGRILLGWSVIFAFVATVAAWAAVAPLSSAVIASGELVVESSRKIVQHLEGGIVATIHVKDGDRVERGQPLVEMDRTEAQARLAVLRKRTDSSLAVAARLKAERDGLDEVAFPPGLAARKDDPWVAELLAREGDQFAARRSALDGQAGLLGKQAEILRKQIDGLRALQIGKDRQIALIRDEHRGLKELFDKGYASRTRLLALERAEAQLEGERGSHISEIAKAEKEVGEVELRLIQLRREFHARAVNEYAEIEKTLAELNDQAAAVEDVLRRTVVVAPSAGLIVGLAVHTPGEVVTPGAKLLEIVPEAETLIVTTRIPLASVSLVTIGQETEVRLTAFNHRITPAVRGRVSYVSADRLKSADDRTPHYEVKVVLDRNDLAGIDHLGLVPGMPVEVYIHSGSRTLFEYVSRPIVDAFYRTMREN
jgi:HlyD family type I secretion membrane fusion protein